MDSLIILVCSIGTLCAFITIFLNLILVFRIVLQKSRRNEEMTLFYYRFTLDIFFGFCLLSYIVYILLSITEPIEMSSFRQLIVFLALPWSNFAACRSIIALSISIERVSAAFFPLKYRLKRPKISNFFILFIGILYGILEDVVLFGFCGYNMEIPENCRVFGCAVNKCFYNYWTIHKAIIFSIIVLLSILLAIKLFVWNYLKMSGKNEKLSRANRLALLDTVTVLFLDFLPSFCGNLWPTAKAFSFDYIGPYNAVGKLIGCSIEVIVVTVLFIGRSKNSKVEKTSKNGQLTSKPSKSSRKHFVLF